MNNTDLVSGYNPEPCFVDWPPNKDANGADLYKWEISHCPNLVRIHLRQIYLNN